ncbi:FKBP-type peptidyl-prolyl cis-trans isomerase [Cardiobacteriaceae bacterium TAE3-ERU3]|nr:FKBP-type peptidyl-prolyl cis-trans isomerase [Cardiobacteriaceae bacterium TAE3-ERU3]
MMTCTALAAAMAALFAQANAADLGSDEQKVSYTIGVDMGQSIAQIDQNKSLDLDALIEGLKQAYAGDDLELSQEEMEAAMKSFAESRMKEMQAEMEKVANENAEKGKTFLEENKSKDGVKTTDSGLQYLVLEEGEGTQPQEGDSVTVNYEGRLLDGTVFDSSYDRGEPITFKLNEVIPGWTEGLQLMKEGGKSTFFIPAELAYGEQGAGPAIGPNSTLVFDVELLGVNDDGAEAAPADGEATAEQK